MAITTKPKRQPTNRWLVLALVSLAQFMVVVDVTIVNVALPSMQRALNITPENLQWIITAYTLAFGGFLLLGGRTADLIGRKKVFVIGVIAFFLGSLAVGISQNESLVILSRGVQGLAAAFMSPAALAILLNTFREGGDRNKALSVWGGIVAGGAAVGLLVGGVLTQYATWRWNFFVNIPIGIAVAIAAIRYVPESTGNLGHKVLDIFGAVTVTSGLMLLVYSLTKAPQYGWGAGRTIWGLVASFVILGAFLINEHRSKHPLMPLSIFVTKNVGKANLVMFPVVAAMFAMFFFLTLYVQNILGFSPSKTGLAFFPVSVVIGIVAGVASQIIAKIGYKPLLVVGPFLIGISLFMMAQLPVHGTYLANILPALVVLAVGMGCSFVSGTIAATNGVSQRDSGLASGLFNTTQQVGGALGLAIFSAVAASSTKTFITGLHHQPLSPDLVAAQVHGYHSAFYVGFGFAMFATLVALVLIKQYKGEKIEAQMVPGA